MSNETVRVRFIHSIGRKVAQTLPEIVRALAEACLPGSVELTKRDETEDHHDKDLARIFRVDSLGKYKSGSKISLSQNALNQDRIIRGLALNHELSHRHYRLSTPFGMFQETLGLLARAEHLAGRLPMRCAEAALKADQHSREVHEGLAVLEEMFFALTQEGTEGANRCAASLLSEDRKFGADINALFWDLEDISLLFIEPIVRAIGYSVLATEVLRDAREPNAIVNRNWDDYFECAPNSPNTRLRTLVASQFLHSLGVQLGDVVRSCLLESFATIDMEKASKWLKQLEPQECDSRITNCCVAIHSKCLNVMISSAPFPVLNQVDAEKQYQRFLRGWEPHLQKAGYRSLSPTKTITDQLDMVLNYLDYDLAKPVHLPDQGVLHLDLRGSEANLGELECTSSDNPDKRC